ncbi:techylectin-5A-like [Tachypleus tridentatus]|uniref:techylectin-5A-like n=1 Tax=Tachypleus tridentatus TaxID=6853 RepID=UPI003FD56825
MITFVFIWFVLWVSPSVGPETVQKLFEGTSITRIIAFIGALVSLAKENLKTDDEEGNERFAICWKFWIENEDNLYRLHASNYFGDAELVSRDRVDEHMVGNKQWLSD